MSDARDLILNLIAALLGAFFYAAWRRARLIYMFRASRSFWMPLLRQPSHILISELWFKDMLDFDMSGFTGLGEVNAIAQMLTKFSEAGLPINVDMTTQSQASPAVTLDNLIVMGGPDVNAVTLKITNANIAGVTIDRNTEDKNVVLDLHMGTEYRPSLEVQHVSGLPVNVVRDYGIIIRAANPFAPGRHVLVIAGAYGYGVIAGMQICTGSAEILHRFMRSHPEGFECIVSYSMTERPPGISKIEVIRPLRPPPN